MAPQYVSVNPRPSLALIRCDPGKITSDVIHQLTFSGWKMEEGLSQFHRDRIEEVMELSKGTITKIYVVIGVNDLR
jgi:hypothetical protein